VYCNDVDGLFRALGHVHNGILGHVHTGTLGHVHNGTLGHVHNVTLDHVHNSEYLRIFIDSIELKLIKVHYRLHIITFPCIAKLFK